MPLPDQHTDHNHTGQGAAKDRKAGPNDTGPTAIDPVCGMTVTLKPDTRT